MDFVLALHSHLPYVLNHGRWPHGSDWLTEAAVDTYLPLLEALLALEREGTPTPVTIGITPVLANQLDSPVFRTELDAFVTQRLEASRQAGDPARGGLAEVAPLGPWWEARYARLWRLYERLGGDLVGAFRGLAQRGRIELLTSAATHGFLPMLGRDESIRLQLVLGRHESGRLFGTAATGLWLPECAYRPAGPWAPLGGMAPVLRRGIEEHVADAGFRFFFADAHMARAGSPLGLEGAPGWWNGHVAESWSEGDPTRTPYRAYRVSGRDRREVAAFVRDPRSSAQVWSRHGGYPGGEWYLEFHKTHWPGGLKFWRVSAPGTDLGQKASYDPTRAFVQACDHAKHFAGLLREVAHREEHRHPHGEVICAPFDTELYGHWWFEGPEFLAELWRELRRHGGVRAVTASRHLHDRPTHAGVRLAAGSWGKNGDWTMWRGPETWWSWAPIWRQEDRFWNVARAALASEPARLVLAQAARALLLAQSSDWQFIIATGEVADYATARLRGHLEDTAHLLDGLEHGLATGDWDATHRRAGELWARDTIFPHVLAAVQEVLDHP